jgi:hypothetical protein
MQLSVLYEQLNKIVYKWVAGRSFEAKTKEGMIPIGGKIIPLWVE